MKKKRFQIGISGMLLAAALLCSCQMKGQAAPMGYVSRITLRTGQEEQTYLLEKKAEMGSRGQEDEKIQPLPMQLKEVLALEQKLEERQDDKRREEIQALYVQALEGAITGGYDSEQGHSNGYAKEEGQSIDRRMADYYRDFIDANGESRTAAILKEYCKVLEESEYQIDAVVADYYEELPKLLTDWSSMDKGNLRYWIWKLGLWTC